MPAVLPWSSGSRSVHTQQNLSASFVSSMDLPLPQVVSALNQELRRAIYSSSCVAQGHRRERLADPSHSFTFDEVSQFDKDITIALATVREWRNSFIPINRIPLDILAHIPTHLLSHNDRLHTSSVCRRWRRTFLQHAELWSELFLSKGQVYLKTLLERAKGSALDVFIDSIVPVNTMELLSTRSGQIKRLDFSGGDWQNIQKFSEVNSGLLPLLHTLTINNLREQPWTASNCPTRPRSPSSATL